MSRISVEEYNQLVLEHTTERQFREMIARAARQYGWRIYWTWNSRHSPSGFPDLVLARGQRLIVAELKTMAGKVTGPQQGWLDALACTAAETYLWRPCDWDEILTLLA